MKDGDRYIDPDGKPGVYNEEQNEAAKVNLAKAESPAHECRDNAQDIGTCSQGCCDKYRCRVCGHEWFEEAPQ